MIFVPELEKNYAGIAPVETPHRIATIAAGFQDIKMVKFDEAKAIAQTLKVHPRPYIRTVQSLCEAGTVKNDLNFQKELFGAALNSVNAALEAAANGGFALTRPPGHHAHRMKFGGFCYFNNAAIACIDFILSGKRVAVIDLDGHYGDGTHSILSCFPNSLYLSIHADSSRYYPYKKLVSPNSFLIDVEPRKETDHAYLNHVAELVSELEKFNADILCICIGFDTYFKDQVLGFSVKQPRTYYEVGALLRKLALHDFALLEGGYHDEIGRLAKEFYNGWKDEDD